MPARALQELARIAQQADAETLRAARRANQIVFEVGGMVLSSRLIEGQFPNYRQLLPDTYEHELRLESRELTDVVRRISLLAQKNAPLRLRFAEGELTVSAQTPDVGEAQETAAGAVRRRTVRDRVQPGVPARRRRVGRRRRPASSSSSARCGRA